MPGLTTRLKLPWTKLEDAADIEQATRPLAESLDKAVLTTITAGPPPAQPQPAGNMHFRSDNRVLYVSDGANWWPLMTGGSAPVGQIAAFGLNAVVDVDGEVRWLPCNGAACTVAQPALRQALLDSGSPYGTSGSDPRVPDLKGRVPVGADGGAGRLTVNNALGNGGGAEAHTLAVAQTPFRGHGHNFSAVTDNQGSHAHNITVDSSNAVPANNPLVSSPDGWDNMPLQIGLQNVRNAPTSPGRPVTANLGVHYHTATADFQGDHAHNVNGSVQALGNSEDAAAHNNVQPYQVVNYFIKAKN